MALRSGAERTQAASQQLFQLFDRIGKQEQIRQQRQQLDRVSTLVTTAQAEGRNPSLSEIMKSINQPAQFDPGIGGIFQNISSRFQPQGGGLNEQVQTGIVSDALRRALQPGSTEIPAGLEVSGARTDEFGRITGKSFARPTASSTTRPTGQSAESKDFDRDIKVLNDADTKGVRKANKSQVDAAKQRLRQNPNLRDIPPGEDIDFTSTLKGLPKEKVGKIDKAFGKAAYDKAIEKIEAKALAGGITEESLIENFNKWWDAQAADPDPKGFGKSVVARSTFQETAGPPGLPETTQGTELDQPAAIQILQEAGGDKEKARKLAKERGFTF